MSDARYTRINGLELMDIADILNNGFDVGGAERKIDSNSSPGMEHANVQDAGREPLTVSFEISDYSRENIERVRQEFNQCPSGAEFCYLTDDRASYVEKASASPSTPMACVKEGEQTWHYKSIATVICRDGRAFGPEIGSMHNNAPLPFTLTEV